MAVFLDIKGVEAANSYDFASLLDSVAAFQALVISRLYRPDSHYCLQVIELSEIASSAAQLRISNYSSRSFRWPLVLVLHGARLEDSINRYIQRRWTKD